MVDLLKYNLDIWIYGLWIKCFVTTFRHQANAHFHQSQESGCIIKILTAMCR